MSPPEQGNDMHNLNLAFEVAEKHLDIPKMLDAEGKVDRIADCRQWVVLECESVSS